MFAIVVQRNIPPAPIGRFVCHKAPLLAIDVAGGACFCCGVQRVERLFRKDVVKLNPRILENVADSSHLLAGCKSLLLDVVQCFGPRLPKSIVAGLTIANADRPVILCIRVAVLFSVRAC